MGGRSKLFYTPKCLNSRDYTAILINQHKITRISPRVAKTAFGQMMSNDTVLFAVMYGSKWCVMLGMVAVDVCNLYNLGGGFKYIFFIPHPGSLGK